MIGIEFTLKDGNKDSYDPIELQNDFKETQSHYIIRMGSYEYKIEKSEVHAIRHYEICKCGYELFPYGCHNYYCDNVING